MVTFRNNNRRSNFRRNDRGFKNNNSDRTKFTTNLNGNENYSRKNGSRNNINAPKLFDKYSNLAREALSAGDKILSENYFQHADHFKRIMNENLSFKKSRGLEDQKFDKENNENSPDKNLETEKVEEDKASPIQ
tara:strand:+ start:964 stop:1365 length:402 start_codon:yes stop_codon:yes gene_type:complete